MKSESENSDLLKDLTYGDASMESIDSLAEAAKDDAGLADQIRDELQFSEMIRQVFRAEEGRGDVLFEQARKAVEREPREWMDLVREGKATTADCDQLVRYFWENPEKIGPFRTELAEEEWLKEAVSEAKGGEAFIEALETRMWAETRSDHFVEDFTARLDREIAESETPRNVVEMPVSWGRTIVRMTGVAAAVAVGAFVLMSQIADRLMQPVTVATVVKSSSDVLWAGGVKPDANGQVKSGQYELESGVVSLRFANGGEMTVEGPAVFDVTEDESAYVYHGVALAKAGPSDTGIALRSKGLSVAEPASLIGIDARSEDSTEAIVFAGDGGVCLSDGGCRSLYEQEAVKADLTRSKLVDIPYNPQPFAKAWELLAGVEKNMGSVRIELPGSEIAPAAESGEVQVFVENDAFQPEEALEVDQVLVGQFAEAEVNPGQSLQARGELRSYLLQLWPTEGGDEKEIEASLTFDHPVVGIIYSSNRLANSDRSVGTSITHVGEEFNEKRGLDLGSDQILLSNDRRTLNLKLHGEDLEVDQVRVLVALN